MIDDELPLLVTCYSLFIHYSLGIGGYIPTTANDIYHYITIHYILPLGTPDALINFPRKKYFVRKFVIFMSDSKLIFHVMANAQQLEKELIRYSKGLPEDALQEILDFIQFIRQKRLKKPVDDVTAELSDLSFSQTAHVEEEFKDYKQLYPSEQ